MNVFEKCSQGKPIWTTSCSLLIGWRILLQIKASSPLIGLWKGQLELWLADKEEGGGDITHEVQISVYSVRVSWWGGGSVRKAFAKKGWGWCRGGAAISLAAPVVYPAISVAVVTSFLPSQTVLNCSGTGSSVWEREREAMLKYIFKCLYHIKQDEADDILCFSYRQQNSWKDQQCVDPSFNTFVLFFFSILS